MKAKVRICEEISGLQAEKDSKLVTGYEKFNISRTSSKGQRKRTVMHRCEQAGD